MLQLARHVVRWIVVPRLSFSAELWYRAASQYIMFTCMLLVADKGAQSVSGDLVPCTAMRVDAVFHSLALFSGAGQRSEGSA